METIYSKINPDKLLHLIQRLDKISEPRKDLIPEEHFIQCSTLKMEKGKNIFRSNIFYSEKYI